MSIRALWLLSIASGRVLAQTSSTDTSSGSLSISTISSDISVPAFTGSQYSYISYASQVVVSSSSAVVTSTASVGNASISQTTVSSTSSSVIELQGSTSSATLNGTSSIASSTTSSATPTNTAPCNNYPEFCNRRYSNITEVCSHNSAFVKKNNAASNQQYPIIDQLNDGVRMLQGETHYQNKTVFSCHTSCNLLNAGPWQDMLETVVGWLQSNPFEVVTILISNSDLVTVDKYVPAIQNSGLIQYVYEPKYIPQHRDQWPTLGEMILTGKRVVFFMDYNANQTEVPYILDQYSHVWETPFSPQNRSFPCVPERPPNLNETYAKENLMYLANHNLNLAIDVSTILGDGGNLQILIPNTALLNVTNGAGTELGSLEVTRMQCDEKWDRPPNFLVVDYYNIGSPMNGSVFEVAARANNVTYNRPCCGTVSGAHAIRINAVTLLIGLALATMILR